ncbi:hypothetical protein E2C01_061977 [Portunus trituberculatus]|uniref:Uncharacterized protein n=1 Tax=Portunus trituberculatus TaxID=210409 RepID=A0A5B7HCE5_PORTR|nr:hypothetical protein [Portunus trituberculatus]
MLLKELTPQPPHLRSQTYIGNCSSTATTTTTTITATTTTGELLPPQPPLPTSTLEAFSYAHQNSFLVYPRLDLRSQTSSSRAVQVLTNATFFGLLDSAIRQLLSFPEQVPGIGVAVVHILGRSSCLWRQRLVSVDGSNLLLVFVMAVECAFLDWLALCSHWRVRLCESHTFTLPLHTPSSALNTPPFFLPPPYPSPSPPKAPTSPRTPSLPLKSQQGVCTLPAKGLKRQHQLSSLSPN